MTVVINGTTGIDTGTGSLIAADATTPTYLDLFEDTDNGSNYVRLIAPTSVAANRTITLPDNTGTMLTTGSTFAGTGPAFSAHQSSGQTISSVTYTKVTFPNEEFDTNSNYDTATSRFTPTVAGYYIIGGGAAIASPSAVCQTIIYKNGSAFKFIGNSAIDSARGQFGSALIYMNGSTDYVELYVYLSSGQALNPGASLVYFQASMVRSA
jgi:hypothetical protein